MDVWLCSIDSNPKFFSLLPFDVNANRIGYYKIDFEAFELSGKSCGQGCTHNLMDVGWFFEWNYKGGNLKPKASSEQIPSRAGNVHANNSRQRFYRYVPFLIILKRYGETNVGRVVFVKGVKKPEDRSGKYAQYYGLPVFLIEA